LREVGDLEMALRLTKMKSAYWAGNGFGNRTAEWRVVGHEHVRLYERGNWFAYDDRAKRRVCFASTRKDCLEIVERRLSEAAAA
jgi:hypothetical protein